MAKSRKAAPADITPSSTDIPREYPADRDRIAMRAYELYLARGGADGRDFDDWLAAERELGGPNADSARGDAGE